MRHRSDCQSNGADGPAVLEVERLAYTLVERARMRCEALLEELGPVDELMMIHRHLGLAGYHTASEFSSALREHLLQAARETCAESPSSDLVWILEKMLQETVIASDAMINVLAHASLEHVHSAHLHVLSAFAAIDRYLLDVDEPAHDRAI